LQSATLYHEITLQKADNHWAEIKSGKVTYRIVGVPDRDFPACQITAKRATRPSRVRCSDRVDLGPQRGEETTSVVDVEAAMALARS
jgi:hypothetical protein